MGGGPRVSAVEVEVVFCRRCARYAYQGNYARFMERDFSIVSPGGVAHIAIEGLDVIRAQPFTRCGYDATGEGWWRR
jgi:hypothetical protein